MESDQKENLQVRLQYAYGMFYTILYKPKYDGKSADLKTWNQIIEHTWKQISFAQRKKKNDKKVETKQEDLSEESLNDLLGIDQIVGQLPPKEQNERKRSRTTQNHK